MRCALGSQQRLSCSPSEEEWKSVFEMCKMQAVVGFVFPVLDKLCKAGQKPPLPVLYEWIGLSEHIRRQNEKINKDVVEGISNKGFQSRT